MEVCEKTDLAPGLDRLARMAVRQLHVPIAGVSRPGTDPNESHPCNRYVAGEGNPLIVARCDADPRLSRDPAVRKHETVAYAGYPLRGPDGESPGVFFVADVVPRQWTDDELQNLLDLAETAESEIALLTACDAARHSAERLQRMLDDAIEAYLSMDADGRIIGWNRSSEQLFGWSAAEVLGKRTTDLLVPPRYRDRHEQRLAEARRTGTSELAGQWLELALLNKRGREIPVEISLYMNDEHGRPVFSMFMHDITERTVARTELENERAFLQAVLNSLDVGVVACDSRGVLTQFNRAMQEIHGLEMRPLGPESWPRTYHLFEPDGHTPMRPEDVGLARAYRGEIVRRQENAIVVPGRPPRYFLTNSRPVETADGRRLGAVEAVHEVTEARRAELLRRCRYAVASALSEATSAQEAAAAAAAAVAAELQWACAEYWEVDEERNLIVRASCWSRPGTDLTGFRNEGTRAVTRGHALAGAVWERGIEIWSTDLIRDLTFPHRGRVRAGYQAGLRTGIGVPVLCGHGVAGALVFFTDAAIDRDHEILVMLRDIAGQIGRFVERRRAEDLTLALAAARRDFNRVIEQVNDSFWTVEITPSGEVRSHYASVGGKGIFGGALPTGTDAATTIRELVHPDDREIFQRYHEQTSTGEPAECECRMVGFDGVTRWVWMRAVPRRTNGHLYIDGVATNITERRELADQRERLLAQEQHQVRRLQELDRMKDELVAVVSHELRNPIAIIAAYTDALRDEPGLADQPGLAVIARTSEHLNHLVEDLLDLARFDSGRTTIDLKPIRLDRLLREAVHDHRPHAETQSVTVTIDIDPLPVVPGDAPRLRQVVDNLLSNAIKYTPAGGTAAVTAHADDTTVSISISDTGIGIPAEQYPKLFTRFFRATTATDRKIKGTGLGLAVTKAIVDAHDGTVTAQPAPTGGTTFTVTLPR
ncbi:PAS domain S-box protein [Actinoplanes hulinensis]|uniref:Sensor-like histidine kinase SenX3 n=1 Tax=Actinoplanes hulinensis TaxID=1144547 RepID=A0ABS7B250_9ACTN|nr:PAS domain S-box protein [Actinoplanes hulinensis]MBW6434484.1 PAS domain S-box protein [Actinoplanes hulinensis]